MVGNFWEYKLSLTQLYVFPYCSIHTDLYINIYFYITFNQFQDIYTIKEDLCHSR